VKLFSVGFSLADEWYVVGVFSTEDKAVEYIHTQFNPDQYAVSPVELDREFPENAWETDYMWWPTRQTKEDAICRAANFKAQVEAARTGKL